MRKREPDNGMKGWPFPPENLGMPSHPVGDVDLRSFKGGLSKDGRPLSQAEFEALPTDADQIAAAARSLRNQLTRYGIGNMLTRGEAADIVELIELLAESVAMLLKERGDPTT